MAHADIQPSEYEEITSLFREILRDFDFSAHEKCCTATGGARGTVHHLRSSGLNGAHGPPRSKRTGAA